MYLHLTNISKNAKKLNAIPVSGDDQASFYAPEKITAVEVMQVHIMYILMYIRYLLSTVALVHCYIETGIKSLLTGVHMYIHKCVFVYVTTGTGNNGHHS